MVQAVPYLIAAFAMTAVSQYIQYQDAKKKEKRVKQQLDIQKKLETERLAAKKQRDDSVLRVKARYRIGAMARVMGNREMISQSPAAIQGVRSNLQGQLDYNKETFEREKAWTASRTELAGIQSETSPFSSQLMTGALDTSASLTGKLGMSKIGI